MVRQRLRLRTPTAAIVNRALAAVACLALAWYGLMHALLALNVSGGTVERISAYRTIYDGLAGLRPDDADTWFRLIVGIAGFGAFLLFGALLAIEIPRPYLARHELVLQEEPSGIVTVSPRAVERAAEAAVRTHPAVTSSSARYDSGELVVRAGVRRGRQLAGTARELQQRAIDALARHELPPLAVHVTITSFDRNTTRELN